MPTYSEFRAYSPAHDAEMSRLSIWDARGQEHFMLVRPDGRGWADRRRICLDLVMDHIEADRSAGQVEAPTPERMRDMILERRGLVTA